MSRSRRVTSLSTSRTEMQCTCQPPKPSLWFSCSGKYCAHCMHPCNTSCKLEYQVLHKIAAKETTDKPTTGVNGDMRQLSLAFAFISISSRLQSATACTRMLQAGQAAFKLHLLHVAALYCAGEHDDNRAAPLEHHLPKVPHRGVLWPLQAQISTGSTLQLRPSIACPGWE